MSVNNWQGQPRQFDRAAAETGKQNDQHIKCCRLATGRGCQDTVKQFDRAAAETRKQNDQQI